MKTVPFIPVCGPPICSVIDIPLNHMKITHGPFRVRPDIRVVNRRHWLNFLLLDDLHEFTLLANICHRNHTRSHVTMCALLGVSIVPMVRRIFSAFFAIIGFPEMPFLMNSQAARSFKLPWTKLACVGALSCVRSRMNF